MVRLILNIFFSLYAVCCLAQDLHFSQFNENHAIVNPALTGVTEPLRATVSYKDQWRSVTTPYRSFGVSFETRLNNSSWKQVDKFRSMTFKERSVGRLAWGLSVYGDKAGAGNLNATLANFSIATFIPVNKKSFFSVSLQGSYIQRRLEAGKLIFPSQYNGSGYDPNLPQYEKLTKDNYTYFRFAGGALWTYGQESKRIATNRQVKAKLGASFYRVNLPHESFFVTKETLMIKYVLHGDLYFAPSGFNSAITPSFLLQRQGSSTELIFGAMVSYYLSNNSKYTGHVKKSFVGYGIYYRNRDAVILAASVDIEEQYAIGLSYDLTLSKLAGTSTMRGGFEITMRYTPPKAFLYQKKVVPR